MRKTHFIALAIALGSVSALGTVVRDFTVPRGSLDIPLPLGTRVIDTQGSVTRDGIHRTWELESTGLIVGEMVEWYGSRLHAQGYLVFYSERITGEKPGWSLGANRGAGDFGVVCTFWNNPGHKRPTYAIIRYTEYYSG